jgi:hypothetical protein
LTTIPGLHPVTLNLGDKSLENAFSINWETKCHDHWTFSTTVLEDNFPLRISLFSVAGVFRSCSTSGEIKQAPFLVLEQFPFFPQESGPILSGRYKRVIDVSKCSWWVFEIIWYTGWNYGIWARKTRSNSDFTSELALKTSVNNLPLCISFSLSIKWEWQSCLHHMIIVKINRVNTCKHLQQCLVSVLSKC